MDKLGGLGIQHVQAGSDLVQPRGERGDLLIRGHDFWFLGGKAFFPPADLRQKVGRASRSARSVRATWCLQRIPACRQRCS